MEEKGIDRIYSFLTNRQFLSIAGSMLLYLIFQGSINKFISSALVDPILSKVPEGSLIDWVWGMVLAYLTFLWIYKLRKTIPSISLTAILILLSIAYLYHRSIGDVWDFKGLSFYPAIKYADLLLIVSISQLFLLKNRLGKKLPENEALAFFHDQSLGESGKDLFGYRRYAEKVAKRIMATGFDESFAIGVNGKWGSGKTSFLDLVKQELPKEDIILIDFKPWNSQTPNSIIKDFFNTVYSELDKQYSPLAKLFVKYSNKLVSINDGAVSKSVKDVFSVYQTPESVNSLHKEINERLKPIRERLVICIDDLDRLDKQELIEVIRLVRNTANFRNTFFLVAYDRDYVLNAIQGINSHNYQEFLEKIFQLEITLPLFNPSVLSTEFWKRLKERVLEKYHDELDGIATGTSAHRKLDLEPWIYHMRDVTRLLNSITLNLDSLLGNVDLRDFIRIEILRLKYPPVYELIKREKNQFLTHQQRSYGSEFVYELIYEKNHGGNPDKTVLSEYLKRKTDLSVNESNVHHVMKLVSGIFKTRYYLSPRLSITRPSKFDRYFMYQLPPGSLSEIEFGDARDGTQKDFNTKILEWVNMGLAGELRLMFKQVDRFDNRADFEKIIQAIFFFGNLPDETYSRFVGFKFGYDIKDLVSKLYNGDGRLARKYYGDDDDELLEFLREIFKAAKRPYTFEASFIEEVRNELSQGFPLSDSELKEIVLKYQELYYESADSLDDHVWDLFHCTKKKPWTEVKESSGAVSRGAVEIPEEAKTNFRQFVLKKDWKAFLYQLINLESRDRETWSINEFVLQIFDSWGEFKNTLVSMNTDDDPELNEFLKFLDAVAEKGYNTYVPFTFKELDISEKLKNS